MSDDTPEPHGHCRNFTTDAEWEGRARMATARLAGRVDLDETDREALRRYPNPPMLGAAT